MQIFIKFFRVIIPQFFSNTMNLDFDEEDFDSKEFF